MEDEGRTRSPQSPPGADPGSPPMHAAGGPSLGVWGHLAILERIGEGSGGDVFRAFDPSLECEVALKLLRAPASGAGHMLEEASRLAGVRHPNVLVVHGAGLRDGAVGIWTELIKGRTLEECLGQQGPLGAGEARLIGIDMCRALAAVHAAGLVHRDLKTSNVMREQGGRLVLMDFGSVGESPDRVRPPLDDNLVGTPAVMAPEQLFGKPVGPTADLYALGVLLYRLTTGHYPIEADTVAELIEKHRCGAAVPLRDRRPDLPTDFVQVIDKAMAADPGDRYPSAGAMERALVAALGGHPPGYRERAVELQVGKWFRFRFATVTVAALVVVSALTLMLTRQPGEPLSPALPTVPPLIGNPAVPHHDLPEIQYRSGTGNAPSGLPAPGGTVAGLTRAPAYNETRTEPVAVKPAPVAASPPAVSEPTATRPAGATATIKVSTEPPGATVTIDGERQMRTANSVYPVSPGSHILVIEKSGYYPQDMTVSDLRKDETRGASLTLRPLPAAAAAGGEGTIEIHVVPPSKLFVNDAMVRSEATDATLRLPAGAYTIRAVNDTYGSQEWRRDIKADAPVKIAYDFEAAAAEMAAAPSLGKLRVVSQGPAGAQVWVDGVNTGLVTPCTVERLKVGSHTVDLVLAGFESSVQSVTVKSGATTEVTFVLKRIGR